MVVNAKKTGGPVVVFAGGGTGGHLYPALAVADELRKRIPGVSFVFFGSDRAIDSTILDNAGCELVRQYLPPIRKAPWTWPATLQGLRMAEKCCRERFAIERPLVVIGSGGLASVAPIRAAKKAGIATVLFNPDAIPGRANRLLSFMADAVFVQWVDSARYLARAKRVQVTGCPVRPEFNRAYREDGLAAFGLHGDKKTLLITGASQGARTINEAVVGLLPEFSEFEDWQVLHLTGDADFNRVYDAYKKSGVRSKVISYTHEMANALAVSDLVVSRAGASTLAEITAVGRPAILMPYPFHKDMHQLANAKCLSRVGAARIVHDKKRASANAASLREAIKPLMSDDALREGMASCARRLGRGGAAKSIAEQVMAMVESRGELDFAESVERAAKQAR